MDEEAAGQEIMAGIVERAKNLARRFNQENGTDFRVLWKEEPDGDVEICFVRGRIPAIEN